jgi:hypothetical protein
MRERVDHVVHCWDDGLNYSVGARLDADEIWRSVVDAWVSPNTDGAYRIVGRERTQRHGAAVLKLSLTLVSPDPSASGGDQ